MNDLQLRLRLGFQVLTSRTTTAARLLRLAEELSKAQKERLEKKFKQQYKKYKEQHPDTDKSEADYVKGLWDQYDRSTKRNEEEAESKRQEQQK